MKFLPNRPLVLASAALFAASFAHGLPAQSPRGPSFDCARVQSQVNLLICATPSLAALDLKLANDFNMIRVQGGIDTKTLDADQAGWLKSVRNQCSDVACLTAAYTSRDHALLEQSLKAASPAAFAETRPFPAPPAAAAAAQALIGQHCSIGKPFPGFTNIPGFLTIVGNGTYIVPLSYQGARFAFLFTYPAPGEGSQFDQCVVSDVVTLPPARPRQAFLQCRLEINSSFGFGVREPGTPGTRYWSIDPQLKRLRREPLGVLGNAQPHCQQPETAE